MVFQENNIMNKIKRELLLMDFNNSYTLEKIRDKDGVYVYRVITNQESYIIKYFTNLDYTREIKNYDNLRSLEVPTINVKAQTKQSILLEDICDSNIYRLGISEDLSNEDCARLIAKWYKILHNNGKRLIGLSNLYNEIDVIKKDSIVTTKKKSNTENNPVWNLVLNNYDELKSIISECKQTLTYNDFYWTNLIISKDMTKAMMFDYNLLGRGFRYSDIRNVCSSLSSNSQRVFLEEYGGYDEKEKIIDDGVSIIVNLIFAFQKEHLPKWSENSIRLLNNGELYQRLNKIFRL